MKVHVYVEGPSDRLAMETLLSGLLREKKSHGISIYFLNEPRGNGKQAVLFKAPVKAVNTLSANTNDYVAVIPDLYPKNKGFSHERPEELFEGINRNFNTELKKKRINNPDDLRKRFKTFCFKHDLEVLLLAAEDNLKKRVGGEKIGIAWKKPVEDQNHTEPPKRIVEALFHEAGKKYRETVDAPVILKNADYKAIAELCPQCFKPFVEFLENL